MEEHGHQELSTREAVRNHLATTIRHYVANLDNGRLPRDEKGQLRVLSVGAGFGYEAGPIVDMFPNVSYKGIDSNMELVNGAQRMNADIAGAEFVLEDAREVSQEERERYGLVLVRHPQVLGESALAQQQTSLEASIQDWKAIIGTSVQKVAPGGYIMLTTDSLVEKEGIEKYLKEYGISVLFQEENRASQPSGIPHRDSYVIIGFKES